MNILFLLPTLSKNTSPLVFMTILIKYLNTNHNISVVSLRDREVHSIFNIPGVRVILLGEKSFYDKLKYLNKLNYDIILSSLFQADVLASVLSGSCKKISMVRADILMNYIYDKGKITGPLMYFIHAISLSQFDSIFALTYHNAKRLIFCKKNKIKIIRNFINEPSVKNTILNNDQVLRLLSVGHLSSRKGIFDLVEIVGGLLSENFNIKLTILGEGPLEQKIRNYINKNKYQESIFLPGYVENVFEIINKNHYSILPSYSEGISRFILESLYCNKKVIVRNTSGINEVLNNENSYLFESNYELKQTIVNLFLSNKYMDDPCNIYPIIFNKKIILKDIEDHITRLFLLN
jgi:glycosyltransferase involved in cell wall biosynthesis